MTSKGEKVTTDERLKRLERAAGQIAFALSVCSGWRAANQGADDLAELAGQYHAEVAEARAAVTA